MIHSRRAFTLVEIMVVMLIVALLIALLLPAIGRSRKVARLVICKSNYHQFAIGLGGYSNDFKELIASFSWKPGLKLSAYSDLNEPLPSATYDVVRANLRATVNQATDILLRRSGRSDVGTTDGLIPHYYWTHLVLLDYLGEHLPNPIAICPEDTIAKGWQKNLDYLSPTYPGMSPTDTNATRLHYSSSYIVTASSYSKDRSIPGLGETVYPFTTTHQRVNVGGLSLGGRKSTEVAFPSVKAFMFDQFGRHGRRTLYFAYDEVRQPILFFDGSVQDVWTERANKGFNPNDPTNPEPAEYTYTPVSGIEPPALIKKKVNGYYLWTREGLKGIDHSGQEIFNFNR